MIDHEYTDEIVCPYCGCEVSDSWEYGCDDDVIDCSECGKKFRYYRDTHVTYNTRKICVENGNQHEWDEPVIFYSEDCQKYLGYKKCKVCKTHISIDVNPETGEINGNN